VKADLHLHTVYSDGVDSPERYIHEALRQGFRAISITDHNTFRGSIHALRYLKESDITNILLLPGAEVRTNIGDVLVYCIDPQNDDFPRDIDELHDWALERDCILVPAHPLDVLRHGIGLLNLFRYRWDAVETHNGGVIVPLLNNVTYALARRLSLPCIGNSDAHCVSNIGTCYSLIYVEDLSIEEVMKSIRRGLVRPVERGFSTRLWRRMRSIVLRRIRRTRGTS